MTKTCDDCKGIGIAEVALGELERCAPCRGSGSVTSSPEPYHVAWREPEPTPLVAKNERWSPYGAA